MKNQQKKTSVGEDTPSGQSKHSSGQGQSAQTQASKKLSLENARIFVAAEKKKIALGTLVMIGIGILLFIGSGAYVLQTVLNKSGDSVLVQFDSTQPIHINLNWDAFGNGNKVDLDIGAFVELKSGEIYGIQALGNHFGAKEQPPYVYLDKDDRSGAADDGENMYFTRVAEMKRALIFAMIYAGTDSFQNVRNGRVVLSQGKQIQITIPLNELDGQGKRVCVVATIEASDDEVKITKEERYFKSQAPVDEFYHYGFKWRDGRKD